MAQRPDDSMMHEPCAFVAIILYMRTNIRNRIDKSVHLQSFLAKT